MLIALDMDGVVAGWDEYLDSQLGNHPELDDFPRQPHRGWNNYADAAPKHKKLVYKILEHPEFYRSLQPIPGAVEAYQEMVADGHDVIFLSTPWQSNPMGYQDKADWLKKHFGSVARSNLILTADKTLVHAHYLVDDKPAIKGRIRPSWTRIFFNQSYNEGLEGPRIMNWTDGSWKGVLYAESAEVQ